LFLKVVFFTNNYTNILGVPPPTSKELVGRVGSSSTPLTLRSQLPTSLRTDIPKKNRDCLPPLTHQRPVQTHIFKMELISFGQGMGVKLLISSCAQHRNEVEWRTARSRVRSG